MSDKHQTTKYGHIIHDFFMAKERPYYLSCCAPTDGDYVSLADYESAIAEAVVEERNRSKELESMLIKSSNHIFNTSNDQTILNEIEAVLDNA